MSKEAYKHSSRVREKISKAKKGKKRPPFPKEWRDNIGKAHRGLKRGQRSEKWKKNLSKALQGRPSNTTSFKQGQLPWNTGKRGYHVHSDEWKSELVRTRKGQKNPNWRGGKSFEPYTAEFNKQLKELIRQRDNYQCQKCGCPEIENIIKLSIHHIDYEKENCLPSNLIALCKRCNGKVNFNREYWIQYFQNKLRR